MGLLSTRKSLTLAAAKEIGAAAEAEARKNNFTNWVAIFDDGGNLLYLVTLDGTQTGSIDVAQQKRLAALRFKRSTKAFQDQLIGAIGVSGMPVRLMLARLNGVVEWLTPLAQRSINTPSGCDWMTFSREEA